MMFDLLLCFQLSIIRVFRIYNQQLPLRMNENTPA